MAGPLEPAHSETKIRTRRRRERPCITCSIRRVKCDYGRPSCNRCLSTGRKCDGYPAPQGKRQDPPPVAVLLVMDSSRPIQCDGEALTAFRFFIQVCAPVMRNYGSHYFWNEMVLQACHADESIKHLTVAASRLGSHRLLEHYKTPLEKDTVFLMHYGRALKLLGSSKNPDPTFLLMACLLLVLCDEFLGNSFAAIQHLIAGRKILNTYQPGTPSSQSRRTDNSAIAELDQIFSKLELHTSEIYHIVRPRAMAWWSPSCDADAPVDGSSPHPQLDPSQLSMRIEQAAWALQGLGFECTALQLDGTPPQTRFQIIPHLTTKLNAWLDELDAFESGMSAHLTAAMSADLHLLRTYLLCLHVLSRCGPFRQEVAFDAYPGTLEYVVVSCALLIRRGRPTRLVPMLFFVATRYRNASIRRRAIDLLRQCGLDGEILARIATRVVRIEEAGLTSPIVGSDVPEENRIRLVDVGFDDAGRGLYLLRFTRHPYRPAAGEGGSDGDGDGDSVPLEHTVLSTQVCCWAAPPPTSSHASGLLDAVLRFDFMAFWNQEDPAFTLPAGFGPA